MFFDFRLFCSILASEKCFSYRWTGHISWCISKANLYLELISLVSKVRFACKLFSFFQRNQDNGGSTAGLLALTWECRNIHMRAVLVSDRKPLPKQMNYKLLLKRRKSITKFFSVPKGSTPEMALVTMQARLVFTPKWERSCPPYWSSRRGIWRTMWWLRPKVLWRNKKVIQHTQERTYYLYKTSSSWKKCSW